MLPTVAPEVSTPLPDKSTSLTIPEAARSLQADIPIVRDVAIGQAGGGHIKLCARERRLLRRCAITSFLLPMLETLQAGGIDNTRHVAGKDMSHAMARLCTTTLGAG